MLMQVASSPCQDPTLRQLAGHARALADSLDKLATTAAGECAGPDAELELAAAARRYLKARRLREMLFDASLFCDPAWDLLLDLYASAVEGRRVCVSDATIAANVPATTGLRWIEALVKQHLVVRQPDHKDGRRTFVTLTPRARSAIATWLRAALAS